MGLFIMIIVLFLLIIAAMGIYILKRYYRLPIIKQIKSKSLLTLIKILPIIILIICLFIDRINTIIVSMHLFVFMVIIDLLSTIIGKISKKKVNKTIGFVAAIVITTLYLSYGYYSAHHVVKTNYIVKTKKDIKENNFRIAQISDSHIGATMDGDDFIKYMNKINKLNPDIVVITGDFVDDDTTYKDMIKSCKGLGNLKTKYGVYFIYGNHDKGYYNSRNFDNDDLQKELKKNKVTILEDEIYELPNNIVIVGRKDSQDTSRKSIKELTKNIKKDKYILTLDHEPNDYDNESKAKVDLVLSGHTHGGQMIPIGNLGVILGINDKTYGIEERNNTTFIVSSGISDWAIDFKTGTISEYVIIDLKK
jgi:predicted MPP superfamily phosphohydrolase